MESQISQLRGKDGKYLVLIEHNVNAAQEFDPPASQLISEFKEALDAAAENDLIRREIEEENKYLKDLKSDESGAIPEIKLEKYEFKVLINKEMPKEFMHYDRLDVPDKHFPKKITPMLFNQSTGEFAYFPRPNSFEIIFNNTLLFSRLQNPSLLPDIDELSKKIVETVNELNEKKFKLQRNSKIFHKRVNSELKSSAFLQKVRDNGSYLKQISKFGSDISQSEQKQHHYPSFSHLRSLSSMNKDVSTPSPTKCQKYMTKENNQNPFSPRKEQMQSFFSYQVNQKLSNGIVSPLEFYGLPESRQLIFRKSLHQFNHKVNFENDQKFQQLVTHRRQYNKYIQIMASTKQSRERSQKDITNEFEEKIRAKVREFQLSKSRLETNQNSEYGSPSFRMMSFRKRRQNSLLSYAQKQQEKQISEQYKCEPETMCNTFADFKVDSQIASTRRTFKKQVEIDRAYQIEVFIGRSCYKKINITNQNSKRAMFEFKTSHDDQIEVLDEFKSKFKVQLEAGESCKPLVRLHKQDRSCKKQFIIYVFADGEHYQNILLDVNYVSIQEFKE